jgi:hypothetical protein
MVLRVEDLQKRFSDLLVNKRLERERLRVPSADVIADAPPASWRETSMSGTQSFSSASSWE